MPHTGKLSDSNVMYKLHVPLLTVEQDKQLKTEDCSHYGNTS